MSTLHSPARKRATRQPAVERPLAGVPKPSPQRPRAPFVVLVVGLMAAGLVGLLLINTSMQRKAFELTGLQERASNLQKREQALRLDVNALSSPDRIAAEAAEYGMVPNASPAFLRLEDGQVLGHPRPAMPGTNLPGLSKPAESSSDSRADDTRGRPDDHRDRGGREDRNGNHDDGARSDRGDDSARHPDNAGDRAGEERR